MWWLLASSIAAFTYQGLQFTPTGNVYYAGCSFGGSPSSTAPGTTSAACSQACEVDAACKAYNSDGGSTCALFHQALYSIPVGSANGICGVVAPASNDCTLNGNLLTCSNPSNNNGGNTGGNTGGNSGGNTGGSTGNGSGNSGGGTTNNENNNAGSNNGNNNAGSNNGNNNAGSNNGNNNAGSNNGQSNGPSNGNSNNNVQATANPNTPAKTAAPPKGSNPASNGVVPPVKTADQPINQPTNSAQEDPNTNTNNSPESSTSALNSSTDQQNSKIGSVQIVSIAIGGTLIFIGAIAFFYKRKSSVKPLSSKTKEFDSSNSDVKIKVDSLRTGDSTLNTRNESAFSMFGFEQYNEISMTSQEISYRKKTESQLKQEYDAIYDEVDKLAADNFIYEDQKQIYYFSDQAGIGQFIDLISVLLLPEDVSVKAASDFKEFGVKKGDEIRIVTHLFDGFFIGIIEGSGTEVMMPVSLIPKPKEPEITLLLCLEQKQDVNLDHYILVYAQQLYPELIKINILMEYKSLDPSNYSKDKIFKTITGKEKVLIHSTPELVEFVGWYLKGITDDLWIYFDISVITDSFNFKSAIILG